MIMIPVELQDKIRRMSNLPTLPQVACSILDYINNPHSSSSDIAAIVSQDISLTAKILRLSNSAFYGMPRTIGNINEAIVILGFKVIYTMVLSLTVFDMFPQEKRSAQFDRKKFWKHCLICALLSKLIAEKISLKGVTPEEAFCAGLLHDIGKIVMEQYLHDDFHNAIDYGNKSEKSMYQAESELLGYSHCDVAEWLISRWNLPEVLHHPIVYHHRPEKILAKQSSAQVSRSKYYTAICHIADYECYDRKITGTQSTVTPPPFTYDIVSLIGLTPSDLDSIHDQVPARLEQFAIFYDLFLSK